MAARFLPDGRNAILNLIGRGEIFGEMALFDGKGDPGVRTRPPIGAPNCSPSTAASSFRSCAVSQQASAMKFIELLCCTAADQVEQVILQNLPGRLSQCAVAADRTRHAGEGESAASPSRSRISEMVGMTRESRQQATARLGSRGWGAPRARRIVLKPEPCSPSLRRSDERLGPVVPVSELATAVKQFTGIRVRCVGKGVSSHYGDIMHGPV